MKVAIKSWQQLPEIILALGQWKHSWNYSADAVTTWNASQLHTVPICRAPPPFSSLFQSYLRHSHFRAEQGTQLDVCSSAVPGHEWEDNICQEKSQHFEEEFTFMGMLLCNSQNQQNSHP